MHASLPKLRLGITTGVALPTQTRNSPLAFINRATAAQRQLASDNWPVKVIAVASKIAVLGANALSVALRALLVPIRRITAIAAIVAKTPSM